MYFIDDFKEWRNKSLKHQINLVLDKDLEIKKSGNELEIIDLNKKFGN